MFVVSGWVFPFLNAIFEVCDFCILLWFWLFLVDKIRKDELRVELSLYHLPKLIAVTIFGILALVLFAWISIRDEQDPVYGTSINGISVLFFIVSVVWTAIIVWVGILMAMAFMVVMHKPYLLNRLLFIGIPTTVVIISLLIGIFTGTFGPLGRTTLGFMYFNTLLTLYVLYLTWGYWPITEKFTISNPSEASPLSGAFQQMQSS